MCKVLDHGEVTLVDSWGSDENIIRAARQSTDGAFRGWGPKCEQCNREQGRGHKMGCYCETYVAGDEKLLRYLYTHNHMTPFEMAGAIFEVKAPIFVFREWHRHRTQSYNEMSARYIPIPDENYIPSLERLQRVDTKNKQAGTTGATLTEQAAKDINHQIETMYMTSQKSYEWFLSLGCPKELARIVLPVGRYSKMWASANLRNWMQFLTLRNAPEAQWEIQQYAQAVQDTLKERFPRTIALFEGV